MAGLAPISMQQRVGIEGRPYPGALAYFYAADTLTAITPYSNYDLSVPLPNPVTSNAFGVFPPIYLDEELSFYRLRVTTAEGVILEDLMTLPIIGPSGGGGGSETPVDPNTLRKTGDLFFVDGSGSRAGAVRANGRTIGGAMSGATERANADCEPLYLVLWGRHNDARCPVIGGRGVSAAADWTAGKQLTLPDYRGRGPLGLDTMGNSSANRLAGVSFDIGDGSTPGSVGGAARVTLTADQMPSHNHPGSTSDYSHSHTFTVTNQLANPQPGGTSTGEGGINTSGGNKTVVVTSDTHSHTVSTTNVGGGQAHTVLDPFFTVTWYYQL